jgi:hypothetical protein
MYLHATCFTQVSWLAYCSTLKLEAKCFSEMSFDFQRTTERFVQEDRALHDHSCENLRSYMKPAFSSEVARSSVSDSN